MEVGENGSKSILDFLETIYKNHAAALARHISKISGEGDYDRIFSAIQSFKITQESKVSVLEDSHDTLESKKSEEKFLRFIEKV